MANKSFSMDMAMATRKFYCHKCGNKLVKNPKTRLIRRGDPDYKKHARMGRMHIIGDIEHTEYNFKCIECDTELECDEQYVIEKMQKNLKKHIISEAEFKENEMSARTYLAKKRKITEISVKILTAALIVLVFYMSIKNGNLKLQFHF